jgi:hypothetical protein
VFDPAFAYLFNSYYEAVGPRQPRPQRGLITRPSADEVGAYRAHVDAAMVRLLTTAPTAEVIERLDLGLAHEEQHQELILMDLLHLFAQSPLQPAYREAPPPERPVAAGAASSPSRAGWSRSATTVRVSPSTTSGRATRSISSPIAWPTGW